jgi:tight adherence protein C
MTLLVSLLAALSVVLFVSGLPPLRPTRMSARVEPYLSGLHGRPSTLLATSRKVSVKWIGRLLLHSAEHSPAAHERLLRRLAAAGLVPDVASFRLEQITWGLAGMVAAWACAALTFLTGAAFDSRVLVPLTALAFILGFLGRDWRLTKQVESRRALLQEDLPTAVDLVALAILAGESVPAAFARVAGVLPSGIGVEFRAVVADTRAGAPTVEALEALKERVPVAGVSRLVDALVSGIERGSPLADVLRAQAEDGRESRRRQLMEIAGRREVLMLVPVVFLIMPVVVAYTLLPGLVALDLLVP